jgi:hypothetical protein
MKKQIDSALLIAQFAAKGGVVTRVEPGVRAIASDRTIYAAMREGVRAKADAMVDADRAEARHHAHVDAFTAAKADGWSTSDAYDYAQKAKV